MVIVESEDELKKVDWLRFSVPIGVVGGTGASIKLDAEELRILRLLLERPIGDEVPASSGGLRVLHAFVRSMEEFLQTSSTKGGAN